MKKNALFVVFTIIVGFFLVFYFSTLKTTDTKSPSVQYSPEIQCEVDSVCKYCNVVMISIDSLRADHLSSYGYKRDTSPNFDDLAKKSTLFMNYFSTSFLTPISEMSVHSSMYPSSSQMVSFGSEIDNNITTLAEYLKRSGYKTQALHSSPEFLRYEGIKNSFDQGFDIYKELEFRDIGEKNTTKIKNAVEQLAKDRFFLWITVGNIHWPYIYKEPNYFSNKNYKGVFKPEKPTVFWWEILKNIYDGVKYPEMTAITKDDTQYIVDNYDNSIRQFDDFLKIFLDKLQQEKLLDSTIILVSSEHGEDFGEHGYIAHYDIYDTQTHVPFLIYSPNVKGGKKIVSITSGVDVFPTTLALLGLSSSLPFQGKNLVPLMCANKVEPSPNQAAYIERIPLWEQVAEPNYIKSLGLDPQKTVGDVAIRTPEWKLILRKSKPYSEEISWWKHLTGKEVNIPDEELYHISIDPNEKVNVIKDYPDIGNQLKIKLENWYHSVSKSEPGNKQEILQKYF